MSASGTVVPKKRWTQEMMSGTQNHINSLQYEVFCPEEGREDFRPKTTNLRV